MTKSDDKRVPTLRFKGFTDEWEQRKLNSFLVEYKKKTKINNQYPVLTSSRQGIFFQKDYYDGNQIASKNNVGYNIVPRDYFTYRHMSDDTIFHFNINTLCDYGIVSTLYPVFTTINQLSSSWLYYYLNYGNDMKRYALLQKQGGSRTYMYFSKLKNMLAHIPSVKEQDSIAKILLKIDKLITLQQRNLENYLLIKKKLSNIFFNDRIVNKNDLLFEHRVKANQLFISYSKKGFSHLPVLSASQDKGMIFRKDESKNILYTHDNLTSYKLVEPDNFVVHLRSFQAGFAYSDKTGIASPAYTIFKFKNNVAYNSVYWKEKFKSYNFIQLLKKITYGVRDGRSISFSDFLSLYLTFPDIKLQNKIGNVLSKLDTQISDQKEIIKKLENIKQFLLQNMFI